MSWLGRKQIETCHPLQPIHDILLWPSLDDLDDLLIDDRTLRSSLPESRSTLGAVLRSSIDAGHGSNINSETTLSPKSSSINSHSQKEVDEVTPPDKVFRGSLMRSRSNLSSKASSNSGYDSSKTPTSGRESSKASTAGRSAQEKKLRKSGTVMSGLTIFSLRSERSVQTSPCRLEDKYKSIKALGNGSFGEVWLCVCITTNEKRAVKGVSTAMSNSYESFRNEYQIAKRLKHANIVQLYDMFVHDDKCFLVMEICTGGDLNLFITSRYVHAFGKVAYTIPDHYDIAPKIWQMLQAIRYLHHHNIVHRDIKTTNFLLQSEQESAPIKLIDFGFAQHIQPGASLFEIRGTRGFFAPEILEGVGYNELVDVWSLGVCVFLLCVGEHPIVIDDQISEDVRAMFDVTMNTIIDFRRLELKPSHADLVRFMKTMLEKDPCCRPSVKHVLSTTTWLRTYGKSTQRCCCAVF